MAQLAEVKRKVAELEAKGDIKNAVAELEKAIKEFSGEGSLYNKLGDLYIKINRKDRALKIYEKGARVFKEETYFPNAIALCKKILRLDKERAGVYELLGHLHKELDQRGEAANYFLEYAERKMKENDMDTVLETYNMIKELVPNNPKILETISAIYEKVGKKEEGEELRKEAKQIEDKQGQLRETLAQKPAPETAAKEPEKVEEVAQEEIPEAPPVEEPSVPSREEQAELASTEEEEAATEEEPQQVEEETSQETPKAAAEEQEVIPEPPVEAVIDDSATSEVAEAVEEAEGEMVVGNVTGEPPSVLSEIDKTIELGELYLNLGSEDEAVDCFRSAANEVWKQKDYDRALMLNKKIAELRPFDLRSRQHLVEIAEIMDDKELHIQAMLDLAESLRRRERKSEAQDLYKRVLQLDAENSIAQEMLAVSAPPKDFIDLGEVLRTTMDEDKMLEEEQTIEGLVSQFRREVFESIGEGDFRSRYDLGVAYKGMGLYQEAIEEFEIAAKDPDLKLKAMEMLGSCFMERDKMDDAMRVLHEGLHVTNRPRLEYFGLHFLLGQCYEKKRNIKEALQHYVNAYQIDKNVPELTLKINHLKKTLEARLKKKKKPSPKKAKAPVKPEKTRTKKSKITYL
jgi:tetratricopeptide (TPR) repeat protein